MADSHDTQQHQGRGFWGCANIFLALGFGAFALLSGAALIFGGLTRAAKQQPTAPETSPAVTGAPAATPTAAAGAPAPGTPAPAPTGAPAGTQVATTGDMVEVVVKPGQANPMTYDITSIHAKAGQKVKITFKNESTLAPLQHSLIVCKPGSRDRIHAAADKMMTEDMAKWMAKGFIPETPDVLHHTKLLNPGESETLEFTAGPEKGEYPYVCTFPGHSRIMQGTLFVE